MQVKDDISGVGSGPVSIEQKVAFLQQPGNYPYPVDQVNVKETHMSWVFLAGDFVYKLKKPVKYAFFDHRTPVSRLYNSEEEIRINVPLADDIYLGIVPLVVNTTGHLQLDGKGNIVDWLVKMKRIPGECMLDYAIEHHHVNEQRLRKAAELLASYYRMSPPSPVSLPHFLQKLHTAVTSNYEQLINPLYKLPMSLIADLTAAQEEFLSTHYSLFAERIAEDRIVDAHGDLRPEHICLTENPVIIDRLEFSSELRIMDAAEELSFLSVECEMMDAAYIGRLFIETYERLCGDRIPASLIRFYTMKKACTRSYLVARHVEESRYKNDPRWLRKANAYLQLAEKHHQQLLL